MVNFSQSSGIFLKFYVEPFCSFSLSNPPKIPFLFINTPNRWFYTVGNFNSSLCSSAFQNIWRHFWWLQSESRLLLTSSKERPGLWLHHLQCIDDLIFHPCEVENPLPQNPSVLPRLTLFQILWIYFHSSLAKVVVLQGFVLTALSSLFLAHSSLFTFLFKVTTSERCLIMFPYKNHTFLEACYLPCFRVTPSLFGYSLLILMVILSHP